MIIIKTFKILINVKDIFYVDKFKVQKKKVIKVKK